MRARQRFNWLGHLLVIVVVMLPGVCLAQGSDPLAEAEAAYAEINFEKTLQLADEAVKRGGLDRTALARALKMVGVAAIALDQSERSQAAVTKLLAIDPEGSFEEDLSPRFREPFMEARGFWATQRAPFGIEVDFVMDRGQLRFRLNDPTSIASYMIVHSRIRGAEDYAEQRIDASGTMYVSVPDAEETPQVEYYYVVYDEYGNRLIEAGDAEVPERDGVEGVIGGGGGAGGAGGGGVDDDDGRSRAWIWAIVGAVLVVGGGVTAGVILGQQAQTVTVETDAFVEGI